MHLDIRASLKSPEGKFDEIADDLKERAIREFDAVPWVDGEKTIIDDDNKRHEHNIKLAFTGSTTEYKEETFMCQIIDSEGRCRYTKSIYHKK